MNTHKVPFLLTFQNKGAASFLTWKQRDVLQPALCSYFAVSWSRNYTPVTERECSYRLRKQLTLDYTVR